MPSETLQFASPRLLSQLYCDNEENLQKLEDDLQIEVVARDDWLKVEGNQENLDKARALFDYLEVGRSQGLKIRNSDFDYMLQTVRSGRVDELKELFENPLVIKIRRKSIVPKTVNQKRYLNFIHKNTVVFGAGPAGTGKTYLAMACALEALLNEEVEKIIVTRPAVEAGEALGFLPGDLEEKILPYLRPLYDSLYDMMGKEETHRLMERGLIEIAPLAYMRGRTLSKAYIVLDEAQNTTPEQMMMFLTRLGEGAKMLVTGDITQIDLPRSKQSGLKQAVRILNQVEGIKVFYFDDTDVVRHPLVQRIINAYERYNDAPGLDRDD